MAKTVPQTIGDSLCWSYANLAMMHSVLEKGRTKPGRLNFIIRARLYKGLRTGSMQIGSYFEDEKVKLKAPVGCWYCGSDERLSVDHIIPQLKMGGDTSENLIYACRSCNSSKGSRDLLAWMASKDRFPPLYVLRRYLKMVILYCRERDLMTVSLAEAAELARDLPFALELIPHKYPPVSELCMLADRTGTKSPSRAVSTDGASPPRTGGD